MCRKAYRLSYLNRTFKLATFKNGFIPLHEVGLKRLNPFNANLGYGRLFLLLSHKILPLYVE